MKFKKFLSIILSIMMIISLCTVAPVTAADDERTVVYQKSGDWTISGEWNYLFVKNDLHLVKGNKYLIEFGLTAPTGNPGFIFDWVTVNGESKTCQSWNYKALTAVYDDGNNDCVAIGPAPNWDATVSRGGSAISYDYDIIWDTATSRFDVTIKYTTASGAKGTVTDTYISDSAFESSDAVQFRTGGTATVKNLTVSQYPNKGTELYKKSGAWTVSGQYNFLNVTNDLHMEAGKKYVLEFGMTPPTGNPSFIFDWITYDGNSKTCDSWNYKALTAVYDDGNNDCVAIGPAPNWDKTIGRGGSQISYDYSIIWDTSASRFDVTIKYKTAGGETGTIIDSYTSSQAFLGTDYIQFRTGGTATIRDFTVYEFELPEPFYTAENGWTVGDVVERADGSLPISDTTTFRPALEANRKYSITYDVAGLGTGSEWTYQFLVDLLAGDETAEKVLSYRMSSTGRWNNQDTDKKIAEGTDGQNQIIIDTRNGEWKAYALGNLSKSGTFTDMSDFVIQFYKWGGSAPTISNVVVTDITPADEYYLESGKTSAGGEFVTVNLDSVFEPGETYKISFNLKPDNMSVWNAAHVTVADGNCAGLGQYGLLYIYDNSNNALGLGDYNKIGYIPGYINDIKSKGVEMEMTWNTATGKVAVDVILPKGAYPEETKSFEWDPGVITGKYGTLKVGADSTGVTVSDLRIRNVNKQPTGSYYEEFYKTTAGGYRKVFLDDVFVKGRTYEIEWNMKPDSVSGVSADVNILGGDINLENANGQNYGIFYLYDNGNNALGLGDWNKIGGVSGFKDAVTTDGIDVKLVLDTKSGSANAVVGFPGKDYEYSWNMGKIDEYGYLVIGAPDTAVTITNLKITDVTPAPLDDYYLESSKTSAGGEFVTVDLDSVFKTGETYKISFNLKPDDISVFNSASVTVADGDCLGIGQYGLMYLYQSSGLWGLGMSDSGKIGYIPGYANDIQNKGVEMEMTWNTATGSVAIDVILPKGDYPEETKSFEWTPGVIAETGYYGTLKIGADSTGVTVSDLRIRNVKKQASGSHYQETYTTTAGGYYRVFLNDVISTGRTYEIEWNMKPASLTGVSADVNILGGDINLENANGQNFGIFYLYENGAHALGLGDWNKIGGVSEYTGAVTTEGIDMKMVWDTSSGIANITVSFPGKDYTFYWDMGVVTDYGYLTIGAPDTAVTITNLSIQPESEGDAPVLTADSIKILAGEAEQSALNASIGTNKVMVSFGQGMMSEDMTDSFIYVEDKLTGTKVSGAYEYAGDVFTLTYETKFEAGKTYTVKVLKVRNANGKVTKEIYAKDFTIAGNGVGAELVSITQNGNVVTNMNELQAGAANVNIKYSNGSGTAPILHIVVGYYNGNKLVHADKLTQTTIMGQTSADYSIDYIVPELEGYDKVQIMVWDGFATLLPLSRTIDLQ